MATHDPAAAPPSYGALRPGLDRGQLLAAVHEALAIIPEGARAVIAVSGGPDSVAMAHLVTEARADLEACVAHVRHGLRADAQDARVASAHARALSLDLRERSVRVSPEGTGPEAAARTARYDALADIAQAQRARWVLVGHTADDQAETVLLNLVRGAGLSGLSGMAAVRPAQSVEDSEPDAADLPDEGLRILRPLLRVRRADVRAFLEGEGLEAVSDPTNTDPQQRRARARHQVLPALASLSGGTGDPVGALTRLADLARDDAAALDRLAADRARRLLVVWGPVAAVMTDQLHRLPRGLASRVVRLLLARVRGGLEGLTADAVAGILALRPGQSLHAPGGVWVTAGGGWTAARAAGASELAARELVVPGVTALAEVGLTVHADACDAADAQPPLGLPPVAARLRSDAWLRRQAPAALTPPGRLGPLPPGARGPAWALLGPVDAPLTVRARRPADRIRLPAGSRKLQDVFVDAGVPRAARDLVPVVSDRRDEPIWVPGLALRFSEGHRCGPRVWLASGEWG